MYVIMSEAFVIFLTDEGGEEKGEGRREKGEGRSGKGEGRREKREEIHGAYTKIRTGLQIATTPSSHRN